MYGPGPSSNVSAISRCCAPAIRTYGVYASVRLIAAFSARASRAASDPAAAAGELADGREEPAVRLRSRRPEAARPAAGEQNVSEQRDREQRQDRDGHRRRR